MNQLPSAPRDVRLSGASAALRGMRVVLAWMAGAVRVVRPTRAPRLVVGGAACVALVLTVTAVETRAKAQGPSAAGATPLQTQAPSSPATPPLPNPSGSPGVQVGIAQATIVGGNIASARERALSDALKQAVAQAVDAIVPEATRAAHPKVAAQILGRARSYVRRYRTLEEGELPGHLYGVRVEADIDEPAVHRAFDRGAAAAAPGTSSTAEGGRAIYLLVVNGPAEAQTAVTAALSATGARVEQAPPSPADGSRLAAAASSVNAFAVALVEGSATPEGKVRGPGVDSVSCALGVRLVAPATGALLAEENVTLRAFSEREERARADCFSHAASAVIPRLAPVARSAGSNELRTVVVDAEISEPAAVPALIKTLRALGSVSAVDLRRLLPGRAEIWVRTRLGGSALAAALTRDAGSVITLTPGEVMGDVIRLRARLRTSEGAVP